MKAAGIVAWLALTLVAATTTVAHAWSPGPLRFDRCVREFKPAVLGRVASVRVVARGADGQLSLATVHVERSWGLAKKPSVVSVYFWSASRHPTTVAHSIAASERVLVFLSADLSSLRPVLRKVAARPYLVRFAKANHAGYLFKVSAGNKAVVTDALFANNRLPLSRALTVLDRAHKRP